MNNKISNPKTEIPTGINMNEKDYLNCLLSILKEMTKNYTIALTEASNETLYQKYQETLNKIISLQRSTFELMFEKGWYSLEKTDNTQIKEKYQMLSQEYQDLEI